ncbi:MAG: lipopolysaccharide heptosyltransferase [Planctomycetota bacterium]
MSVPAAESLPGHRYLPKNGSVLVIRMSALGDVLFALETVAALHRERPDVAIDFLVEDRFAALLEDHPHLRNVVVYPRKRTLAIPGSLLRLRRTHYDVVFDLHGILKSAMHLVALRATHKVAAAPPAAREGSHRVASLVVPMPDPLPHRADVGHLLLAAIGLSGAPAAPTLGTIAPPPELLADLPHPLVVLHPGTSAFAAFKRWPAERFAELAARLTHAGFGVAVSHGPGEEALVAPILAAAPAARAVDGKRLGLRGLAGVLQRADVVVAADTGPLHIAAAVGARCVALFGPKETARYGPRSHGEAPHAVLFHSTPCRPCSLRDCVSPQCVLGITVDTVERHVQQLAAAGAVR